MTLGTPVLLSGKQVLRVVMGHDNAEKYKEELLQTLIDQQPHLLPICDFCPGVTSVFSLGREIPVDIGGGQGFIDNMLVTDDGQLVIVETKLWRNPESTRQVIAQTLQYAMSISQLPLSEFEDRLRRSDRRGRRLGQEETVAQYAQNLASTASSTELAENFEDEFDRLRRAGEIVLLIVADGIRASAERLVQWMNAHVGSAPYKLGLVELRLYELTGGERIVIPKTLLRIREASRHVVSISLQGMPREQVTVAVTGPDTASKPQKVTGTTIPMTAERLTELIRATNPPEIVELAEQLRTKLKATNLAIRPTPSEMQYGVKVNEDFVPLVHLSRGSVWFQIPTRAVHSLGEDRFVECKKRINQIAVFYRSLDVDDPTKINALTPKYAVLSGTVEAFVDAVQEIAATVTTAMEQAS